MLIIGAKGLAKELLEVCKNTNHLKDLVFYDSINKDKSLLYDEFPIIHDEASVINYFTTTDKRFILGLGNIKYRVQLSKKFVEFGGKPMSLLSPDAIISSFDVILEQGIVIMPGAIISNGVSIGENCLIYFNSIVTHDVTIGKNSIISPGATILGRSKIGNRCFIGANATVLPDVTIGDDVIIGAGAVVTKNINSNTCVVGIPARKL